VKQVTLFLGSLAFEARHSREDIKKFVGGTVVFRPQF